MAVANTFKFADISSDAYGIVLEGSGDYSAPKRVVETVSIPGRNGDLLLDQGHWENITVTYKAVVSATTQSEFNIAVSNIRNAILSKRGYQRLMDSYHPQEYRMAMYESGFDDEPEFIGKSAIFDIVFNCKPQRFLVSGETAQDVASGNELHNLTSFDASPLIAVEGYGTLTLGNYEIELENALMGKIGNKTNGGLIIDTMYSSPNGAYNTGDTVTCTDGFASIKVDLEKALSTDSINSVSGLSGCTANLFGTSAVIVIIPLTAATFTAGTDGYYEVANCSLYIQTTYNGSSYTNSVSMKVQAHYTRTGDVDNLEYVCAQLGMTHLSSSNEVAVIDEVYVDSTMPMLGNPTYIDCDLGEAYKIVDDEYVSLNRYIDLGSDLPVLVPGSNEITFDNTITDVKITPRWWML